MSVVKHTVQKSEFSYVQNVVASGHLYCYPFQCRIKAMLKLLIFLIVARACASPIEDELLKVRPNSGPIAEEPCHCPSPAKISAQTESPTGTNQLVPRGASIPGFNSMQNLVLHGTPCVCNIASFRRPIRDDYKYTPGIGSHKFHTRALPWNEARKICNEEGGYLAVINSVAEAQVRLCFNIASVQLSVW